MKRTQYTIGYAAAIALLIVGTIKADVFTGRTAMGIIITIAIAAVATLSAQLYQLSKKFNH